MYAFVNKYASWRLISVKACCNVVVYVMKYSASGVVIFIIVVLVGFGTGMMLGNFNMCGMMCV